ncbi:MAG: nickel-binding protein [Bacteroidota bacterium]
MPIYLDRHDVLDEVNAEHVAQMHQLDLKIQHEYNCRGFTYWFDEKRKAGFCLIEAPNKNAIQEMHDHAHGAIPSQIIEVQEDLVESFLGRIIDPEKQNGADLNIIEESAFRVLMVLRVRGNNKEQKEIDADLSGSIDNIKKILSDFDGSIVRMNYQNLLASFTSVSNAVNCAEELINTVEGENTLKIGISAGEPVTGNKRMFEDTIQLAERLCDIVEGDIVVSSEVKELYENENINTLSDINFLDVLNPGEIKFLTKLMDFTESVWNRPKLMIDDFSEQLGLSNSQVYRKILSLTGKSPNNFLKEYRLNKAVDMLKKQTGNISEIAYEAGFNSPAYFSKCFLKSFGVSPSDYIKSIT